MSLARTTRLALALLALPAFVAAAEISGVDRFHQVGPTLYRGAQPSDAAYPQLAKLGVTTVLDLRRPEEHSTTEEAKQVQAAGMRYVNIPMTGWTPPTTEQIAQVRAVMDTGGVVFVHCKQGRDRTGTVSAIYRMEHDGWANDKAYAEAREKGLRWYFSGLNKLIKTYKVDPVVAAKYVKASPPLVVSITKDSTTTTTVLGAESAQKP